VPGELLRGGEGQLSADVLDTAMSSAHQDAADHQRRARSDDDCEVVPGSERDAAIGDRAKCRCNQRISTTPVHRCVARSLAGGLCRRP